jgi:hypothetical protein
MSAKQILTFFPANVIVLYGSELLFYVRLRTYDFLHNIIWGWGSSVSIVTDYGLDDRGSIPDRGRGFSF